MLWLTAKYAVTALLVVVVSEIAKRSDRLGGLVAALPLVTILTLIWLYAERQPTEKIAAHAWYTLWYVLPTLPMFALFPYCLPKFGFWLTLVAGIVVTAVGMLILAISLKRFGIALL